MYSIFFPPGGACPAPSAVWGSPSWGWYAAASSRVPRRPPPSCFGRSWGRRGRAWRSDSAPSHSVPAVCLEEQQRTQWILILSLKMQKPKREPKIHPYWMSCQFIAGATWRQTTIHSQIHTHGQLEQGCPNFFDCTAWWLRKRGGANKCVFRGHSWPTGHSLYTAAL